MKLVSLSIKGPESYESWTGLKGAVTLSGQYGKQELVLSPGAISRLLTDLGEELARTAKIQALQVPDAIKDAVDGGLLLESDGEVKIPS